ncbi:MAG: spore coat protein [Caulobacteraceae bacterium]|nr:spore coat protein [Caulobacteraceae bacterium]
MKGIILAGGTGSRLFPLTKVTNKHLLPVGKYPMIFYSIDKLKKAGIKEIMIVTGKEHMGAVVQLLGSGRSFGVALTYRVQDQAGGIAQALGLAKDFVNKEPITVILGDNVFEDDISNSVLSFDSGAKIFLKEVDDPHRFGVAEIFNKKVVGIEEKPKEPKTNYAVTGIYIYDNKVFDYIKNITPSTRGELEITDVNNQYIKENQMEYSILSGWWTDAGTHISLYKANEYSKNISLGVEFNDN